MGFPQQAGGDGRCRPRAVAGWLGRRAALVAIALGIVGAVALVGPDEAAAQGGAVVDTNVLNLRAEPGTWAEVVGQMGQGEWVELLSGPTWDGWYELRYGGVTGWAYGGYLAIDGVSGWDVTAGGAEVGGTGGFLGTAWVATDGINVRAWPGDDADVLDVIGQGGAVTVTGEGVGGYVPIEHWSGHGWVWGGFLSFAGPVVPAGPERWVDVDRSTETVTLFEGDQVVASYWGAMGFDQSDAGFYATANGTFYVYHMYGDLSWTDWGGAWVRHWVGFDPARANGFHSWSMDAGGEVIPGGAGPTGGCVALAPWAAEHLFRFVGLGTRVEVHW